MKPHDSLPYTQLPDYSDAERIARSRAFYEAVRTRRTCRYFSDEAVPRAVIENAILAAGTAPNGANHQPWHFAVIESAEKKKALRAAAEEEERALTAGALNDLFYLVDAHSDAVNALEAVFGDAGAASWDEDEEDDPEDLASQARIDEIRKLFEIVDERDLDDEDDRQGEK